MATTSLVEVKTNQASVELTRVGGPLRIQGEGLEIRVLSAMGDTYVNASSSSVEITRPTAAVTVESHYGDVKIRESRSDVTIFSKDGNVEVTAAAGPVSIEADGEEVAVEWESMRHQRESLIYNDGGNVSVTFPAGAACRVEATAGFGKVETELEGIELLDGGSRAEGSLGDATMPTVHVEAAGRVFLGAVAEASEEP